MSDIQKFMFAICATAFFIMGAHGLLTYGDSAVRVLTICSLFLAGAAQFFAQSESPRLLGSAWAMIIFSMLFAVMSLVIFAVTL